MKLEEFARELPPGFDITICKRLLISDRVTFAILRRDAKSVLCEETGPIGQEAEVLEKVLKDVLDPRHADHGVFTLEL